MYKNETRTSRGCDTSGGEFWRSTAGMAARWQSPPYLSKPNKQLQVDSAAGERVDPTSLSCMPQAYMQAFHWWFNYLLTIYDVPSLVPTNISEEVKYRERGGEKDTTKLPLKFLKSRRYTPSYLCCERYLISLSAKRKAWDVLERYRKDHPTCSWPPGSSNNSLGENADGARASRKYKTQENMVSSQLQSTEPQSRAEKDHGEPC